MLPASPAARALLSVAFACHLLMVVNYVWLDEGQKRWLRPVSKPYVEWLQLTQKWNMFRNPARSDLFLEADGIGPAGTTPLPISQEPPQGPFLRLRYDRMIKVHNILVYEGRNGRYRHHYARWLCTQGDFDRVVVYLKTVKHWTPAEPAAEVERTVVEDVDCHG